MMTIAATQSVEKRLAPMAEKGKQTEIRCTHSDWCTEQVGRGNMHVGVMHMVMMMVSRISTAPRSRLLRLDRHRCTGLALSLPKPFPFQAAMRRNYRYYFAAIARRTACCAVICGK